MNNINKWIITGMNNNGMNNNGMNNNKWIMKQMNNNRMNNNNLGELCGENRPCRRVCDGFGWYSKRIIVCSKFGSMMYLYYVTRFKKYSLIRTRLNYTFSSTTSSIWKIIWSEWNRKWSPGNYFVTTLNLIWSFVKNILSYRIDTLSR